MKINMKANTKITMLAVAAMGSLISTTATQAVDLTASSASPTVFFNDTDDAGSEWYVGGNLEKFNVYDYFSGSDVLRILPGTSNSNEDSLVVAADGNIGLANNTVHILRDSTDGRVGIGTSSPEAALHVKTSDNGNIILQSSEAKWGMSTLVGQGLWLQNLDNDNVPFRIDGSALTDSIRISPTGVGIGVATPAANLDVAGNIQAIFSGVSAKNLQTLFKMSANNTDSGKKSDAGFVVENSRENFSYSFRTLEKFTPPGATTASDGGFAISKQATGAQELVLINPTTNDPTTVELYLSSGASNVNGQWVNASSRSYKKNIHELSGDDAMQAMRGLKSVKYQFKSDNSNEQMIGFIAEDVPELLATKDRRTVDPLRIVSVLAKAIQVQDEALLSKGKKIADMEAKINQLVKVEARLSDLEALIQRLPLGIIGTKK